MRIEHSDTAEALFSISEAPDALPTASCYAGTTLLGAATVTALAGTNDYRVTYALPASGIADGTVITFRVDADVSATALSTLHLVAGVLNETVVASNTIPTAADNATQVRTELATELARIDATVSSRSTFAGGAVSSVTNPVTTDTASRTASQATGFAVPGDQMTLTGAYQASLVAAIDAGLLDAGDATDLIASIVTRIGNTNVDQAAFVAAVKAALFSAGSASNKLEVDALGRVEFNNTNVAQQDTLQNGVTDILNNTVNNFDTADRTTLNNLATDLEGVAMSSELQPAAAAALVAYDPPTRTEATADQAAILAAIATIEGGGSGSVQIRGWAE